MPALRNTLARRAGWLVYLILFLPLGAQAATPMAELAARPLWRALLHVNDGAIWHGKGQSLVEDPAFFLAPEGSHNALAELQAEVAEFSQPTDTSRCRFPARYKFLSQALGWQESAPFAHCPDYLQWRSLVEGSHAELLYFVPLYQEAASSLGHISLLLVPNNNSSDTTDGWTAINFRALPTNDLPLVRQVRGLAGRLPGVYWLNPIFANAYAQNQDRDAWRYRLNLTPEEVSRLIDHAWEVKSIRFPFAFLDENCLFRALQLLQVARPATPLLDKLRLTWTPALALRELERKGVISGRQYLPSAQTRLRWQARQQPQAEVPVPSAPDQGHGDHMLALAAGQRDGDNYTDLTLRQLQHGWLDNAPGFANGKGIEGLGFLTLRYYADKPAPFTGRPLRLQSLRLLDRRNLMPRSALFKPLSWFSGFGAEQVPVQGERLASYVQGGPGLAWQWKGFMPYVFLKARVEHNSVYQPWLTTGGGSELGLLYYHGRLSAQLETDGVYFQNDDWRSQAKLGINWALGRNNALRLKMQHERNRITSLNEWSLGWRHYFD